MAFSFNYLPLKFFVLVIVTVLLPGGCTKPPSSGVLSGDKLSALNITQTLDSSTPSGQMQIAGALMLSEVAEELSTQGFSLSEIKEIAETTHNKLKVAGSLAVPGKSSTSLSLSSDSTKASFNPLSKAGGIVVDGVSYGVLTSSNKKVQKDYKLLSKIATRTHKSLSKVKADASLQANLNDTQFEGAVSKITGAAIGLVDDFGVEENEISDVMAEVTSDFVAVLKEEAILKDNTEIAKKVISGLAQGAAKIKLKNVSKTSVNNPSTAANSLAFDIYNEETGANLDKSNPADFDVIAGVVLEGAAESMDDSIADAVKSVMEVAVVVYDKSPEEIASVIETVDDIYEAAGVEVPSEIDTYVKQDELIEELVTEGVISEEEATAFETAVETAAESIKPVEEEQTSATETKLPEAGPEFEYCNVRFPENATDNELEVQLKNIYENENSFYQCRVLVGDLCPVSREYPELAIHWHTNPEYSNLCEMKLEVFFEESHASDGGYHHYDPYHDFWIRNENSCCGGDASGIVGDTITLEFNGHYEGEGFIKFFKSLDCSGQSLTALTGWQTSNQVSYLTSSDDLSGCLSFYAASKNGDGVDEISAEYGDVITGRSFELYSDPTSRIEWFYSAIIDLGDNSRFDHHAEILASTNVELFVDYDQSYSLNWEIAVAEVADCKFHEYSKIPSPGKTDMSSLSFSVVASGSAKGSSSYTTPSTLGCYVVRTLAKNSDSDYNLVVDGTQWDLVRYTDLFITDDLPIRNNAFKMYKWDGSSFVLIKHEYWGAGAGPNQPSFSDGFDTISVGDRLKFEVFGYDPGGDPVEYAMYKHGGCDSPDGPVTLNGYQATGAFEYVVASTDLNYEGNHDCGGFEIHMRNANMTNEYDDGSERHWFDLGIVTNGELPPSYQGGLLFYSESASNWVSEFWQAFDSHPMPNAQIQMQLTEAPSDPNSNPVTTRIYLRNQCDNSLIEATHASGVYSITVPDVRNCSLEIISTFTDDDSIYFRNGHHFDDQTNYDLAFHHAQFEIPDNFAPSGSPTLSFYKNGTLVSDIGAETYMLGDEFNVTVGGITDPDNDTLSYHLIFERHCRAPVERHLDISFGVSNSMVVTLDKNILNPYCHHIQPIIVVSDNAGNSNPYHFDGIGELQGDMKIDYAQSFMASSDIHNIQSTVRLMGNNGNFIHLDDHNYNSLKQNDNVELSIDLQESENDSMVSYKIVKVGTCQTTPEAVIIDWANMSIVGSVWNSSLHNYNITVDDVTNCARFDVLIKDNDNHQHDPAGFDVRKTLFTVNDVTQAFVFNYLNLLVNSTSEMTSTTTLSEGDVVSLDYEFLPIFDPGSLNIHGEIYCDASSDNVWMDHTSVSGASGTLDFEAYHGHMNPADCTQYEMYLNISYVNHGLSYYNSVQFNLKNPDVGYETISEIWMDVEGLSSESLGTSIHSFVPSRYIKLQMHSLDTLDHDPNHNAEIYSYKLRRTNCVNPSVPEYITLGARPQRPDGVIHRFIENCDADIYVYREVMNPFDFTYTPDLIQSSPVQSKFDCSGLGGGSWIAVVGNPVYDTSDFCVMKYEASDIMGTANSGISTPWTGVTQNAADLGCTNLGPNYALISNSQWMTIGESIRNNGANWDNGIVGSGTLNIGHSDNAPAAPLAPNSDDNLACDGTGQTCNLSSWNQQKRTHQLSNGEIIWDFGGNVWEWTSDMFDNTDKLAFANTYLEYNSTNITSGVSSALPLGDLISTGAIGLSTAHGIGSYYPGLTGVGGSIVRGGRFSGGTYGGIFAAFTAVDSTYSSSDLGFRCVYVP